jgi:plastocyanin
MKRALLATFLLALAGCPKEGPNPPPPPDSHAGGIAPAGSGTLDLVVRDETGKPLEGAVLWAPGLKDETPVPAEPIVLSQEGLEFRPRFLVARRGQAIELRNADPEVHNVRAGCDCYPWNDMVKTGDVDRHDLTAAGEGTITCSIHGHMRCQLLVLDAPHARTDVEGHARLALPLGPRKLRVWAVDRDRKDLEVTIAAVTTAEVALPLPTGPQIVRPEALPWPTVAIRLGEALDEAVRCARRHDGDAARAAVMDALERWYSGNGFFGAIKQSSAHPEFAEEEKSELRKLATRAENAANGGDPEQLARQVEKIKNTLLDIARGLPKR